MKQDVCYSFYRTSALYTDPYSSSTSGMLSGWGLAGRSCPKLSQIVFRWALLLATRKDELPASLPVRARVFPGQGLRQVDLAAASLEVALVLEAKQPFLLPSSI